MSRRRREERKRFVVRAQTVRVIRRDLQRAGLNGIRIDIVDACDVPPPGWYCTREKGHDGPCAALPTEPVTDH